MRRVRTISLMWFTYAGLAHAGIVRVETNSDSHGQGWMFLDVDSRCKVVTPAHVIRLIDGRPVSTIKILDDRKREFSSGIPEVLSEQLDVAILTVNGANDPSTCGTGRLSDIGVARRVAGLAGATLETTGEGEVVRVPVRVRAARMDQDRGSKFSVQPTISADRVVKGWSGSMVVDDEGALGMVVQVDDERNEAIAVRADVIRRLIDSAAASPRRVANQPSRTVSPIILTAGSTTDLNSTSERIFAGIGLGWNVIPKDHRIVFVVVLESPIRLQRVRLRLTSKVNAVEGMDIAVSEVADGAGWESLKYCRADGGTGTVNCSVLGSTVRNVRITLKTATDGPVALSNLSFE